MKAVFFSLLLAVIFAVAPTNTENIRDPRQTQTQCGQMLLDKQAMILNTLDKVTTTCTTTSCSSTCRSLLNTLKSDIGCCFESYGDSTARKALSSLLEICDISPPGRCNHASSVVVTFSTIALFSIIAFFFNHV